MRKQATGGSKQSSVTYQQWCGVVQGWGEVEDGNIRAAKNTGGECVGERKEPLHQLICYLSGRQDEETSLLKDRSGNSCTERKQALLQVFESTGYCLFMHYN